MEEALSTDSVADGGTVIRLSEESDLGSTSQVVSRARLMAKKYQAHNRLLREAVAELDAVQNSSNDELDKLISSFIANNEPEKDHCPSRLLESKHQLNVLLTTIRDLSWELNTTEVDINTTTTELTEEEKNLNETKKWCQDELDKCQADQGNNSEMLDKLKNELEMLKLIANPTYSHSSQEVYDAAAKSVNTWVHPSESFSNSTTVAPMMNDDGTVMNDDGTPMFLRQEEEEVMSDDGTVGLVQILTGKRRASSNQVLELPKEAQELMDKTKESAENLATCMMFEKERQHVHLLSDATADCTKGSFTVSTGNLTKTLELKSDLAEGGVTSFQCSQVDPALKGVILVMCNGTHLVPDASKCEVTQSNHTACKAQLQWLEIYYVKAYVELTRLVGAFEVTSNTSACIEIATKNCKTRKDPIEAKINELTQKLVAYREKIKQLQARIDVGQQAAEDLRKHIDVLRTRCQEMTNTTEALNKVLDVIHVMGECPGLGRPEFHIPLWVGGWQEIDWTSGTTDSQLDTAMDAKCASLGQTDGITPRAAEASEIAELAIEGIPEAYNGTRPLLGKCSPATASWHDASLCTGAADATGGDADPLIPTHPSGHSRTCWDENAQFAVKTMRMDCNYGPKAIMCVLDRGNIRNVPDL
jgi:hypothetical protein